MARREFLDEILELLRQDGPTVFFSSHILSDVERVADHIGILADGALKISEPLDRLKDTVKQRALLRTSTGTPLAFSIPGAFRSERSGREWLVTMRLDDPAQLDPSRAALGRALRDTGPES